MERDLSYSVNHRGKVSVGSSVTALDDLEGSNHRGDRKNDDPTFENALPGVRPTPRPWELETHPGDGCLSVGTASLAFGTTIYTMLAAGFR